MASQGAGEMNILVAWRAVAESGSWRDRTPKTGVIRDRCWNRRRDQQIRFHRKVVGGTSVPHPQLREQPEQ